MALQHPLLKDGGLLPPLLASLAQWHLIDDPEQGLGLALTEALKATLREADGLKRALGQVRRSKVACDMVVQCGHAVCAGPDTLFPSLGSSTCPWWG